MVWSIRYGRYSIGVMAISVIIYKLSISEQHQSSLLSIDTSLILTLHVIILSKPQSLPEQTTEQFIPLPITPFASLFGRHEVLQLLLHGVS